MNTDKKQFLEGLIKLYPSFDLHITCNDKYEFSISNFDYPQNCKFNYYLTISLHWEGGIRIIITSKKHGGQQISEDANQEFIINTLQNLFYLGY